MKNTTICSFECPVQTTVNLISGKWKIVILYYLLEETKRFGGLQKNLPNITHRSLTLQLRDLEKDGLIERKVYPVVPPKVEYSLTPLGASMKPIIHALYEWGESYQKKASAGASMLDGID